MTMRRALLPSLLLGTLLAVSGCQMAPAPSASTPGAAATCADLAAQIVDAVQAYVDSFAGVGAADLGDAVTAQQQEFTLEADRLRKVGEQLGCAPDELAELIRGELGRLTGGTPVQDAVADTFRADPLGTLDPSDPGAGDVVVTSAETLAVALATAGSGTTIRLTAGTYAYASPLVVLRPVTLVGAGDGTAADRPATTITSRASGATLVVATGGNVELRDLALEHTGRQPASVMVVAGGGYRFERVRLSGGVAAEGVGGFGLVLRPSSGPLTPTGDARELTEVTASDNEGGGIVVAGAEQPTITRARVSGEAGCGLCWVEQAAGTAVDSATSGLDVGLRVDGGAAPSVSGGRVDGAGVGVALTGSGSPAISGVTVADALIGVQATGAGSAQLSGLVIEDARELGLRLSGTGTTTVSETTVRGRTKVAVATVADARSSITGGRIRTTGDVGLIWGERSSGTASGVVVRGPKLGLQLSGESRVDVTDVVADRSAAAAVLAGDTSSGTLTRLTCGKKAGAAVVVDKKSTVTLVDSPTCEKYSR